MAIDLTQGMVGTHGIRELQKLCVCVYVCVAIFIAHLDAKETNPVSIPSSPLLVGGGIRETKSHDQGPLGTPVNVNGGDIPSIPLGLNNCTKCFPGECQGSGLL